MMTDTVDLLEYTVEEIMEKRPTLALVYYPSKFDFYWFIARIVNLLKRHQELVEPLPEIRDRLEALIKGTATKQILKAAKAGEKGQKFWVEFLGNYGKKDRNEDAIFSTSLALNALLDAWTTREGSAVSYDEGTPEEVKTTIESGVEYLMQSLK